MTNYVLFGIAGSRDPFFKFRPQWNLRNRWS